MCPNPPASPKSAGNRAERQTLLEKDRYPAVICDFALLIGGSYLSAHEFRFDRREMQDLDLCLGNGNRLRTIRRIGIRRRCRCKSEYERKRSVRHFRFVKPMIESTRKVRFRSVPLRYERGIMD
jgi:hypothetical protein